MRNILITSAGRRVSLVEAFKNETDFLGIDSKVYTSDISPELSSACYCSEKAFRTPPINNEEYIPFLLRLVIENQVGIVVPTIDIELHKLAVNRDLFLRNDCHIIIPEDDFVTKCIDKRSTAIFFNKLGISIPKDYKLGSIEYPLFIKPYNGSRSQDTYVIHEEADVDWELISNPKYILQEYIDPKRFYEVTIDAYFGRDLKLKCLIPRKRIQVRDGEVSKGLTIRPHYYADLFEKISRLEGVRGCINIQFFVEAELESRILGSEINPRFGGGFPLSYYAGGNFPRWIIQEYLLEMEIQEQNDWRVNSLMLRYDEAIFIDGFNAK